jgi:hypothetical protein
MTTTGTGRNLLSFDLAGMSAIRRAGAARARFRRLVIGAAVTAATGALGALPAGAADTAVSASYFISISGFTVGRADVDVDFSDAGYTASIKGSTRGLVRLVSDAQATLTGSGRIRGSRVLPANYTLETKDGDFETHVDMAMRGGAIVALDAEPALRDAPDRVPITSQHKQSVLDPVAAFIVALGNSKQVDGDHVCHRTVPVFDGWQRYDVSLYYKETKTIDGHGDSYSGDVIVCGARYVPIAGHRTSGESVQYMADNKRLEMWLVPVADTTVLLPYKVVIGTQVGDLVIGARKFVVSTAERHASAN